MPHLDTLRYTWVSQKATDTTINNTKEQKKIILAKNSNRWTQRIQEFPLSANKNKPSNIEELVSRSLASKLCLAKSNQGLGKRIDRSKDQFFACPIQNFTLLIQNFDWDRTHPFSSLSRIDHVEQGT